MSRPVLEVADILRGYGEAYRQKYAGCTSSQQWRVVRALQLCRTSLLGGHVDQCNHCGHQVISYNSCRNRHCPKCQTLAKADWLLARRAELLPLPYYHVVFTLPGSLAPLALQNKKEVYNILFAAASQTLLTIAADPKHLGATPGFIAILHTWGQNLLHHPHLHCVVPAGGLAPDQQSWIPCRTHFFLPVRVLSRLYRRLFLDSLQDAFAQSRLRFQGGLAPLASSQAFARLIRDCRRTDWVVYAKRPFGGPEKVLDYLARYTHRIAISNHRFLGMANGKVSFSWRDYKRKAALSTMTLDAEEFIRRFLMHVLPDGFVRIRSYGFLANRHRAQRLQLCRKLLGADNTLSTSADSLQAQPPSPDKPSWATLLLSLTGRDPLACPCCHVGRLLPTATLRPLVPIPISGPQVIDSS